MKIKINNKLFWHGTDNGVVDAAVSNCKTRAVFFTLNNKFKQIEGDQFTIVDEETMPKPTPTPSSGSPLREKATKKKANKKKVTKKKASK